MNIITRQARSNRDDHKSWRPSSSLATASAASSAGIALSGAVSLAVAMGIGRFAFTPLLPMMLHDKVIDLQAGSWLASANYIGYLAGAVICMFLPRLWSSTTMIRLGLVATVLLTFGMALPWPILWPLLRLLAGIASAVVFVFTSGWCLAQLAQRGKPALGATIFTGPGAGIVLSGLIASGLVALHVSSTIGWVAFGVLAVAMSAPIWRVVSGRDPQPDATSPHARLTAPAGSRWERTIFTLAYGIAGFGYIITATFLPVIARAALPGSVWLDLFWPILGLGVVIGALVAARVPRHVDPRDLLIGCYLMQGLGVILTLLLPDLAGFILGSLLVGLPFTAISFFAMQDARRLRPDHAARFMGLLTAAYGLGQIAGPPLVAVLLAHAGNTARGFAWSLGTASSSLLLGAVLYLIMRLTWPLTSRKTTP
jgi:MFS family permease